MSKDTTRVNTSEKKVAKTKQLTNLTTRSGTETTSSL